MNWHTLALQDVPPRPWKNGGGLTRELAAWPNAQDWVWRMSVAEVTQSGPFSHFAGVQRWFAVLAGAGVQLDLGATNNPAATLQTLHLSAASPALCFAGHLPVHCTLHHGATQDFNLMLRPGTAHTAMVRVTGTHSAHLVTTKTIAVYASNTRATVQFDHEVLDLNPNTLAWCVCPAGRTLQLQAQHALWMEFDA